MFHFMGWLENGIDINSGSLGQVNHRKNLFSYFINFGSSENNNKNSDQFSLAQNYPNPFNEITKIQFSIPVESHVHLSVHNFCSQEIVTLFDGMLQSSNYSIEFNAHNLPEGVYFYRILAGDIIQTKKMIIKR